MNKGLDTKLNITQIELGLAEYFGFRKNIIVPNVSWGMLNHEADLLVLNKSGYLTEIEIKRSYTDFLADFKKDHRHDDTRISWRYFAVPSCIVDRCKDKLSEVDREKEWGLLQYADVNGRCFVDAVYLPTNATKHDKSNKLALDEQLKLVRLASIRIWSLKAKIIGLKATPRKANGL